MFHQLPVVRDFIPGQPWFGVGTSEYLGELAGVHESVNTSPEVWEFTLQQEVKKELFVAMT